ncbi:MAG: hypothetical protein JXA22_06650 [Candidatus Thermoplasmatota archaeon]|nr:hypothetical protein [Candidatus Thermoplasmatota archaeon]
MNETDIDLSWLPADLERPFKVQAFLNSIPYDPSYECRSPMFVHRERKAHCFEGALFAAACLRRMGYQPLLVDLRAYNDDDHVIAVFREKGRWGSIAKSNFTTLRFREPVYRSIRELAMSYFDLYFNTAGQKTLRSYSAPMDLSRFDDRSWMTTEDDLEYIGDALDRSRHYPLLTDEMVNELNMVEDDLLKAGLLGSDPKGLFEPK